jgi:hypothetical protein
MVAASVAAAATRRRRAITREDAMAGEVAFGLLVVVAVCMSSFGGWRFAAVARRYL